MPVKAGEPQAESAAAGNQPQGWAQLEAQVLRYLRHLAAFSAAMSIIALAPAIYSIQIFDRVLAGRSVPTLVVLTLGVLVALGFLACIDQIRTRVLGMLAAQLDRSLGPEVIRSVLSSQAAAPGDERSVLAMRDVAAVRQFLSGPGVLGLFDAPWLLVYAAVIFVFHPILGLELVVGAGVLVLLTWMSERAAKPAVETIQVESRRASQFLSDGFRQSGLLAAHGSWQGFVQHWQRRNDLVTEAQDQLSLASSRHSSMGRFVRQLLQSGMLGTAAALVVAGHTSPGVIIAATILLARATQPLEILLVGWRQFVEARLAYGRLSELLKNAPAADALRLPEPQGRLDVERLLYTYKGAPKPVIAGVQLSIEPGTSLAVIGPSGSGKSTLARLLCGIVAPQAGAVRLDGADIAKWDREHLGPFIGYMPQSPELFAATIAENIARMGKLDSAEVVAAARMANAHDFILRLPKGYDTELGEGGVGLSGGEVQRIALARALYGKPRLVVLDEPNANLDREGDEALLFALAQLQRKGVTTIMITHRPTLLPHAQKILVLREGTMQAFGNKEDVLPGVTAPPAAGGRAPA